jgi:hypothetical protein
MSTVVRFFGAARASLTPKPRWRHIPMAEVSSGRAGQLSGEQAASRGRDGMVGHLLRSAV